MQKSNTGKEKTGYTESEIKKIEEIIKILEKKIRGEEKCRE